MIVNARSGVDCSNYQKRAILVSGPPRGGTTWVGRILSSDPGIAYLHEPFNPSWYKRYRPGICTAKFQYWFFYVDESNESAYVDAIRDLLAFRYRPLRKVSSVCTPKDAVRLLRDWFIFSQHRFRNRRPLVKDPIAVCSVPWLASRFDMQVVLLVRHPAAFVGSMKKVGWTVNLRHFLSQERLMELHLAPYRSELQRMISEPHDIVDNAIAQWNIIHHMIAQYRVQHPNMLILRHEDIAADPENGFRQICKHVHIDYSSALQDLVRQSASESNPTEVPNSQRHSIYRNSLASLNTWKSRLSSEEVARVRQKTSTIYPLFYSESDWE